MKKFGLRTFTATMCLLAFHHANGLAADDARLVTLGASLFFETSLSKNRTQSCATCHDPAYGFSDPRGLAPGNAVSRGDDLISFGRRNAPTASYASTVPAFHKLADGSYEGGLFLDGRAHSGLEAQAGGPPLNPAEMGMPDEATIVTRLRENPSYVSQFQDLWSQSIFDDPKSTYTALTQALAAYERSTEFSPFDSRYDRYLRGEEKFTDQEELGRVLFFSQQFTNCSTCHALKGRVGATEETFTNNRFFDIGVPANPQLAPGPPDMGLGATLQEEEGRNEAGKFRVPTLRNVAVTAPYMHNGVFKDLKTVILFYNKYNTIRASRQINPETGLAWADAEVTDNIALKELKAAPALDEKRIDALVAFLRTLTDKKYEKLLSETGR